MRTKQELSIWVKVGLEVMTMKEFSIFPKAPDLVSYQDTHWVGESYPSADF